MSGWARLSVVIYCLYSLAIVGMACYQYAADPGSQKFFIDVEYVISGKMLRPENQAPQEDCIVAEKSKIPPSNNTKSAQISAVMKCINEFPTETNEYTKELKIKIVNLLLLLLALPLVLFISAITVQKVTAWVAAGFKTHNNSRQ